MNTNIVNKIVFQCEAQFMKRLSNTEDELKKSVAYKKACIVIVRDMQRSKFEKIMANVTRKQEVAIFTSTSTENENDMKSLWKFKN